MSVQEVTEAMSAHNAARRELETHIAETTSLMRGSLTTLQLREITEMTIDLSGKCVSTGDRLCIELDRNTREQIENIFCA